MNHLADSMNYPSLEHAIGLNDDHIDYASFDAPLIKQVGNDFLQLKQLAIVAGFDLRAASGYRSFKRQLGIWNGKASGARPVLDEHEVPIDVTQLDNEALLFSILRWSAIPGTSRHHWGTDLDIFDANVFPDGKGLQLTLQETEENGAMFELYKWLEAELPNFEAFSRPYYSSKDRQDRQGVACEPWHLSHKDASEAFAQLCSKPALQKVIERSEILLKSEILKNFDLIYEKYITVRY